MPQGTRPEILDGPHSRKWGLISGNGRRNTDQIHSELVSEKARETQTPVAQRTREGTRQKNGKIGGVGTDRLLPSEGTEDGTLGSPHRDAHRGGITVSGEVGGEGKRSGWKGHRKTMKKKMAWKKRSGSSL